MTPGSAGRRFELDGVRAEHILIETDTDHEEIDNAQPRVAQKRFLIINRAHALETELILFEGGWISLRERRRNAPGVSRLLNLRYLDHRPEVSSYLAKRTLATLLALLALATMAGVLAGLSVRPGLTIPTAFALFLGAGVAFIVFAYRTQKRVVFRTTHGRAPVLRLLGTIGSFRALRRIVPEISAAISGSQQDGGKREQLLRSEMREHYRLRESGVIDQTACGEATQRILARF